MPLIFDIKGNSLDDGPGIRSVVFFKGCPLSCIWCHNPEGRNPRPELSFDREKCVGCGGCLENCSEAALDPSQPGMVDRSRCTLCFRCSEQCPSSALEQVGQNLTVTEVVNRILKDQPFYKISGGGVTLSGGEPTVDMGALSALTQRLHTEGISTLIETCGYFAWETFARNVLPWIDIVYMDIKLFDPVLHRRFCGTDNRRILENFAALQKAAAGGVLEVLPRIPLVPGITDQDENLRSIGAFLRDCGAERVQVMEYNPLWVKKCLKLGNDDPPRELAKVRWMDRIEAERCRSVLQEAGLSVL